MPDPNDPRLKRISEYYDAAGNQAVEENNRAAAAVANRIRQTGGTGTISVINAMLDENEDALLSTQAKTRAATQVAKAQALASETINIFNQNLDNFWNVYNSLSGDPETQSAFLGAGIDMIASAIGMSPEMIAAWKKSLEFMEWTETVHTDILWRAEEGKWTDGTLAAIRYYLARLTDSDGARLSDKAINGFMAWLLKQKPKGE